MNVILLHGFLGSSQDWTKIQRLLLGSGSTTNWTCTALDLPTVSSWDEAVSWLRSAVEAVPPPRCLVGYSMGGRLALALGLDCPDLLEGLVLESTSPGIEAEEERASRRALDTERANTLRTLPLHGFLEAWYGTPFWATLRQDSPGFATLLRARLQRDPAVSATHVETLSPGRMPDQWPRLATLSVPSLWVAGHSDAKYTQSTRRAVELVPGAQLVLTATGHNVHHEAPEAFAEAVGTFVRALRPGAAS